MNDGHVWGKCSGALAGDPVNHPPHYQQHPSGIECITIAEAFNFNLGNAIKYIWRCCFKAGLEDLRKARWYLDREIARVEQLQAGEERP